MSNDTIKGMAKKKALAICILLFRWERERKTNITHWLVSFCWHQMKVHHVLNQVLPCCCKQERKVRYKKVSDWYAHRWKG